MIVDWINNNYDTDLRENDLIEIKDFSILWNIFENEICDKRCSLPMLKSKIINMDLNITNFLVPWSFYKNRYVTKEKINLRFHHLGFEKNKSEYGDYVQNTLLKSNPKPKEILLSLVFIIYRFRNNLFHGEKYILDIKTQKNNFQNANKILMNILNK